MGIRVNWGVDEFILDDARVIASEDSGSFCIFGTMVGKTAKSRDFGGNIGWIVTIRRDDDDAATSAHAPELVDSEPKEE